MANRQYIGPTLTPKIETIIEHVAQWFHFDDFRELARIYKWPLILYRRALTVPVNPSTITLGGDFTGVTINEQKDIAKFEKPEGNIKFVGSNFGEFSQEGFVLPPKKEKKSNRGRKPKEKKAKKRLQGSGKYFNSQITFYVVPNDLIERPKDKKFYIFKVFRTGTFQVPGVLNKDMSDIRQPLEDLRAFLNKRLYTDSNTKDVEIVNQNVQMRNCKTVLADDNLSINIPELGQLIDQCQEEKDPIGIKSVSHTSAQSKKITVKFGRPTKKNAKKETTLKILKQKINMEGAVDADDVENIYNWLCRLILDNYDEVIYDKTKKIESDSSDTDEYPTDSSEEDELTEPTGQNDYANDPYGLS